eukprot:CAMPEP_0195284460 /NCGR_PEP_ID=MMETSP0707-20130614/2653_1 /TAXON_ID=33640 /ORGANISM="Asterionellopsis glacialis, Strain CCMP134" /LENGTH=400 /DNA_ID=CAMNT_0040343807 /DNA_START=9 /DNA_END=1211 /DNA_ORIENTATION=+
MAEIAALNVKNSFSLMNVEDETDPDKLFEALERGLPDGHMEAFVDNKDSQPDIVRGFKGDDTLDYSLDNSELAFSVRDSNDPISADRNSVEEIVPTTPRSSLAARVAAYAAAENTANGETEQSLVNSAPKASNVETIAVSESPQEIVARTINEDSATSKTSEYENARVSEEIVAAVNAAEDDATAAGKAVEDEQARIAEEDAAAAKAAEKEAGKIAAASAARIAEKEASAAKAAEEAAALAKAADEEAALIAALEAGSDDETENAQEKEASETAQKAEKQAKKEAEAAAVKAADEVRALTSPRALFQNTDDMNTDDMNSSNSKASSFDGDDDTKDEPIIVTTFHTPVDLKHGKVEGVQFAKREQWLSDDDFKSTFGMSKTEFNGMRKWRRQILKKKVGFW